jgi:hypothetical protein
MEHVIQFTGAGAILLAFVATQVGRLSATAPAFLWLNFIGAGLLTISAIDHDQWGFVLLEGTWTAVALLGLVRAWRHRGDTRT